MYGAIMCGRSSLAGMVAVRSDEDLADLVKEAEVSTGKQGRTFVIAGADRLEFRVSVGDSYFEITNLSERDPKVIVVMPERLDGHVIGAALSSGQLFTPLLA